MGDRTTVTLSFLESQKDAAIKHFDFSASDNWFEEPLAHYQFDEVNYGELDFLSKLKAEGIAYESEWDRGNEYDPGVESLRFTSEGKAIIKNVFTSDCSIDVHTLIALLDKPEELKALITAVYKDIYVLPWDNQEEYGKLYRARDLINPS